MNVQRNLKAGIVAALSCLFIGAPASAATFVYVSNNEDGNIGMYTLRPDGSLQPGERVAAVGKAVMPMTVSPDKRFLVAAIRSKPFSCGFAIDPSGKFIVVAGEKSDTISVYSIDQASRALKLLNKYPTGKGSNWVEIVSFD
jgi:6-phosphogluconolactonase